MKRWWLIFAFCFALCPVLAAQTTVTISSTVTQANAGGFGLNLGSLWNYGNGQIYKDLGYAPDGYMTPIIATTVIKCNTGGTNDTTHWYSNATGGNAYPASFWVGGTLYGYSNATGASLGSATISASSANTSTGLQLTLSTPITTCSTASGGDQAIIRQTTTSSYYTPQVMAAWGNGFGLTGTCTGAVYSSDVDPASTNTIQSLSIPSGCTAVWYDDAVLSNKTNTNSGLAATQVPWININGSYTETLKYKCGAASGSGLLIYSLARNGGGTSYVGPTTVTPSCTATSGSGWATATNAFTGSETGAQTTTLQHQVACTTGPCLLQDVTVIEGSTLAGNTTPFRDAVVKRIEDLHPKIIRGMNAGEWGATVQDLWSNIGTRRWSSNSAYTALAFQPLYSYPDQLALAHVVGADLFLNLPCTAQPGDGTTMITQLAANSDYTALAAAGHTVYMEICNEAWNSGAGATLFSGDGLIYGTVLGPMVAAMKGATGFNSTHMKIVGNSWFAPNQSYSPYGWMDNTCARAAATGIRPDYLDIALYNLGGGGPSGAGGLWTYGVTGGNVNATGEPWTSIFAEPYNWYSSSPASGFQSVYKSVQDTATYCSSTPLMVYEANMGALIGTAATQTEVNQMQTSVGAAIAQTLDWELAREAGVTGPIVPFDMGENYNNCSLVTSPGVCPLWGTERIMATGPGQAANTATVGKPMSIAEQLLNTIENAYPNLCTATFTPPTSSYAGGQNNGSANTVAANSAVPKFWASCYTDGAGNFAVPLWNTDQTGTSQSITLAGSVPTGTVTQYIFGNGNAITDHNENTYLGAISPVVTLPTGTSTSGTSYTVATGQLIVLTYSTSSPPPPTVTGVAFALGSAW